MKKPFKVAVMHSGTNYGKVHRQCMELLMKAAKDGHAAIQLEYVDCKRIRDLETFISNWLKFEEKCIEQSSPYASQKIPNMMKEAEKLLGIGIEVIIDESTQSLKD